MRERGRREGTTLVPQGIRDYVSEGVLVIERERKKYPLHSNARVTSEAVNLH